MLQYNIVLNCKLNYIIINNRSLLRCYCEGSLIASCSLLSHSFTDDVQAYKHCLAFDARSAILSVSGAAGLLNESNRLRLNPLKTQYIFALRPPAVRQA